MHRSVVAAAAAAAALAVPAAAQADTVEVVARGLDNPRGMDVRPGQLFVAEAGRGGATCTGEGLARRCVGATGAVTRVDLRQGGQKRVASGLPSLAAPDGSEASGPADLAFRGATAALVVGLGADPALRAQLGPPAKRLGWLFRLSADGRVCRPTADLAAFEAAHDPDGAGPDSDPVSVETAGSATVVADAGANSLLDVAPATGAVRLMTALEPAGGAPAAVVRSADGAYLLGTSGSAADVLYVPAETGPPIPLFGGFTAIADLAAGVDGELYVLQRGSSGALLRVDRDGTRTELAVGALGAPQGLAVGRDGTLYVASGAEPATGEVLAVHPTERTIAELEHLGRRVRVVERFGRASLIVNDTLLSQDVFERTSDGVYRSTLKPFRDDEDPAELARALIDDDGVLYDLCPLPGC